RRDVLGGAALVERQENDGAPSFVEGLETVDERAGIDGLDVVNIGRTERIELGVVRRLRATVALAHAQRDVAARPEDEAIDARRVFDASGARRYEDREHHRLRQITGSILVAQMLAAIEMGAGRERTTERGLGVARIC
ncbi:MAG: hypothetical protein QOI41_2021, partial [Myxococcales bacterium]|nr:hypothetical protein [Myxococcales bacterium]